MADAPLREPLELATSAELDAYAATFGLDRDLIQRARKCPVCDGAILVCDNGWLDAKAGGDRAICGVMRLGPLVMMGSPGGDGSVHSIHVHQPDPEEDLV